MSDRFGFWAVFDLGGIFVGESGPGIIARLTREFGVPEQLWTEELRRYHRALTTGEMTLLQAYAHALPGMGVDAFPADALAIHLEEFRRLSTTHDPQAVALAAHLRESIGVACLTNTEIEAAQICREGRLFDYFDRAYLSIEIGRMKPDRDVYECVLADLRCPADHIFFVDDRIENVLAAREVGMQAELFEGMAGLEAHLDAFLRCAGT